jgi:hypothetical protein
MRRELSGQVRRTLGGGRPADPSEVWDTATNEIPPEVGESPECQWCPICRAARRMRESGPGLGGQISGAGDAVASVVQDAVSALDSILSRAGGGGDRRPSGGGERSGGGGARPSGGGTERRAGGSGQRPAGDRERPAVGSEPSTDGSGERAAGGREPRAGDNGDRPAGGREPRAGDNGDRPAGGREPRASGGSGAGSSARSGQSSAAGTRERTSGKPEARRRSAAPGDDTARSAAADRAVGDAPARGDGSADLPGSVAGEHGPGGWKPGDRLATEHVIDPDPWAGATADDDGAVDGGQDPGDTAPPAADAGPAPLAPDGRG